jgi:hypothetical protein
MPVGLLGVVVEQPRSHDEVASDKIRIGRRESGEFGAYGAIELRAVDVLRQRRCRLLRPPRSLGPGVALGTGRAPRAGSPLLTTAAALAGLPNVALPTVAQPTVALLTPWLPAAALPAAALTAAALHPAGLPAARTFGVVAHQASGISV